MQRRRSTAEMITAVVVVMMALGALPCVFGQGDRLIYPPSRSGEISERQVCDEEQSFDYPITVVLAGQSLDVQWGYFHPGDPSLVRLAMVPWSREEVEGIFDEERNIFGNFSYTNIKETITIPQRTPSGRYTLQWKWKTYYSCTDLQIVNVDGSLGGRFGEFNSAREEE